MELIVITTFIIIFCLIGRGTERRHLRQLEADEKALEDIVVLNTKTIPKGYGDANLVYGEVAIASDKLKEVITSLRNIFGGEIGTLSRQVLRTRREAIVRMKKAAKAQGCNLIVNLRYEGLPVTYGEGTPQPGATFMIAYGTALKKLKTDETL